MDINKLFLMQKELDEYIEREKGLESAPLFDRKMLALLVEVGELANETRCFKFWSKKGPSEKKVILEEFVDGLHFILSVGIEIGLEELEWSSYDYSHQDITKQFLDLYESITIFKKEQSIPNYEHVLTHYFYLGKLLDFSEEEIIQAYIDKNKINFQRQKNNY
jgi:dimeric dUTPase (all-alpha-NTP-PPase superfamily)